jgi:hypothetical protein
MTIRGRKLKPTIVRLLEGNRGHRPIPYGEPTPVGKVEKPTRLLGRASSLWDEYIARAYWLTWADEPKAFMWCHLHWEFEDNPRRMSAARMAQLRALGSELGLDPASRARLGANDTGDKPTEADKYFD